jgi:lipopolysaccharide export system protein LptA
MKIIIAAFIIGLIFANAPNAVANKTNKIKEPIVITADRLKVQQKKSQATFIGSVEAIQGNVNLRSNKMIVHYANKAQKSAGDSDEDSSIKSIDVIGKVFMTTPQDTVSGDKGFYDINNDKIRVTGNVKITRGLNIITGNDLVYDLKTGESEIRNLSQKQGFKQNRVTGVFVPK